MREWVEVVLSRVVDDAHERAAPLDAEALVDLAERQVSRPIDDEPDVLPGAQRRHHQHALGPVGALVAEQSLRLLQIRRANLEARVDELREQMGNLPERSVSYSRFQQRLTTVQDIYNMLVEKYYEALSKGRER